MTDQLRAGAFAVMNAMTGDKLVAYEFLKRLFGCYELRSDETVCVARTWLKPGYANAAYPAYVWDGSDNGLHQATHFNIGLVSNATVQERTWGARVERKLAQITGVPLIVLDDVGTKSARPSLPPTYEVETRPGNSQLGYALVDVCRDLPWVDTLIASAIAAGISDPGANTYNRLMRLPGSLPSGKQHRARLVSFAGHRYEATELLDLLGIPLVQGKSLSRRAPVAVDAEALSVDVLLEWLRAKRLVRAERPNGWHAISCPWGDKHSGGDQTGAYYKTPTADDAARAFSCKHGHCADRDWQQFITKLVVHGAPPVPLMDVDAINAMKSRTRKIV